MNQITSLEFFILNAVADDWESIVQIEADLKDNHPEATRELIFGGLHNLFNNGYIKIMEYPYEQFPRDPSDCWFTLTPEGRDVFDEYSELFD